MRIVTGALRPRNDRDFHMRCGASPVGGQRRRPCGLVASIAVRRDDVGIVPYTPFIGMIS